MSEVRGGAQEEIPHALMPEARGGRQEELSHAPTPEAKGGGQEDQPHALVVRAQEGLEELSHVEGQEGRWCTFQSPVQHVGRRKTRPIF